ncbi:MAG: M48 family metallopeptidase [Nocardioidaceae bacterium]
MTTCRLDRRLAWVLLAASVVLWVVLAAVLVPWQWVPGGHPVQVPATEVFTHAEIARAAGFASVVRPLSWASLAVSLVLLLVLGLTGLGARLVSVMPRRLRIPLGVAGILLLQWLLTLPFLLLIRHQRLEEGLTKQPLVGWLRDQAVSLGVSWVATTVGLMLLVWLARRSPRYWFAWASLAGVVLTFTLSFLYPVLVEPLFNRFTPLPAGPLRTSILELADREGVHVDDVLVADASRRTTTLNAYVSGFGNTKRVVLYDNLIRDLPQRQVELVVAHELGHAKHRDVLLGTTLGAVGSVTGICLLALLLDAEWLRWRGRFDGPADPRLVATVLLLVGVGSLLVAPLQNTVSRAIEARADRASLAATGDTSGFVELQHSLAVSSLADPTPPAWAQFWWGSHPTALQRIGIAKALER